MALHRFSLGSIIYDQRMISKPESVAQFSFEALDSFTYMSQRQTKFSTLKMHPIISFPNCLFYFPSQWPISLFLLWLKPETLPSPPSFPYSHSQSVVQTSLFPEPVSSLPDALSLLLPPSWSIIVFLLHCLQSCSLRSLPTLLIGSFAKRKV